MGLLPVALEEHCPSAGSLLIPDDLDSRRCQCLQVAAESSNRLVGERVARAVRTPGKAFRESDVIPVSSRENDAGHFLQVLGLFNDYRVRYDESIPKSPRHDRSHTLDETQPGKLRSGVARRMGFGMLQFRRRATFFGRISPQKTSIDTGENRNSGKCSVFCFGTRLCKVVQGSASNDLNPTLSANILRTAVEDDSAGAQE
jgi:hypothetical protein